MKIQFCSRQVEIPDPAPDWTPEQAAAYSRGALEALKLLEHSRGARHERIFFDFERQKYDHNQ